jgi:hypothetical protein
VFHPPAFGCQVWSIAEHRKKILIGQFSGWKVRLVRIGIERRGGDICLNRLPEGGEFGEPGRAVVR